MDSTTNILSGYNCAGCGAFVANGTVHACNAITYYEWQPNTCGYCGKPLFGGCMCVPMGTITTTGIISVRSGAPVDADDDDPPGILFDLPSMRERAERVLAQRRHKDVSGETAHLLAGDILALIEALEEAYPDD